ncbi:MAG: bifunctional rhamnulose-1-phosphate aldolase/short-chain dehydrogenase [Candidatus Polarisedimenticolia bacterium]
MESLWRDEEARDLRGIDLLVYRSRLIGRDTNLVVWGGGNTSLKQIENDFRGRETRVMRVKGSGSDLKAIEPKHFPGIRLDDLEPLYEREAMSDDEMVAWLVHCLMEPNAPRPSIETLLHGFVPHPHIDHTHADAILALTDTADGRRHVEAVYGSEAIWIPYRRPGFVLSRQVARAVREQPKARCVVLEKHGLITWGASARESYEATIEMNSRAEAYARERAKGKAIFGATIQRPLPPVERRRVAARIAPTLRGLLSGRGRAGGIGTGWSRVILRYDDGDDVLEFAGSEAGPQLCLVGPATPDHLLYTKPRPLLVPGPLPADPWSEAGLRDLGARIASSLEKYAAWYDLYFEKNAAGGEPRLEPYPRVVLLPGVGMFTAWKDAKHTGIVADIYHHTIRVMRDAQGLGTYRSLDVKDTFDVEYWPMELYKLTLAPKEQELARRPALITGGGSGIGRSIARRFAEEGCHVVVTDLDLESARAVAEEIDSRHGAGRALAIRLDVTDEPGVQTAFETAAIAYGGLDIVVSNAGFAHSCPVDRLERRDWERSLEVNATGHFLVAREAVRMFRAQGLGGSLVINASKNVLAPGRDFAAYSAAKAAAVQLARVLAIESGEHGVRVNILNPDAVFQDSGLWSAEVREERARAHGIRPEELEEFYRKRNLLQVRVTGEDVAEAALFFASDRSARTTGCILTTDGGVKEAFPR